LNVSYNIRFSNPIYNNISQSDGKILTPIVALDFENAQKPLCAIDRNKKQPEIADALATTMFVMEKTGAEL